MRAGSVTRIEKTIERAASAVLGFACSFAAYVGVAGRTAQHFAAAAACVSWACAYLLSLRLLGAVKPGQSLAVPPFELADFERFEPGYSLADDIENLPEFQALDPSHALLTRARELTACPQLAEAGEVDTPQLLLTDQQARPTDGEEEPLLLDDVLGELEPDSRVVRLFDAASAPTPGQLKSRIDRHLDRAIPQNHGLDAAQALQEALAELRRSIR